MSSHKEAPAIANDPAADNTDVYAFVSPENPRAVTFIANFVPLEDPAGGPNFASFGDDVLYEIHIDNDGDAQPDVTFQFTFVSTTRNPGTFLYNTGPIDSIHSTNWNRRQFGTVKMMTPTSSVTLGTNMPCPPVNIGPHSTPKYVALAQSAIHKLNGVVGGRYFAGQRAEGFYVDLGAVFDLGTLRPVQNLHAFNGMPASGGVNATKAKNIMTIALQVPITAVTKGNYAARSITDPRSTIGVWASASRRRSRVYQDDGSVVMSGNRVQVSRQANPLFNEVLNGLGEKDLFNATSPVGDSRFAKNVEHPGLAALLNVLYPGVFPNLAAYSKPRADLAAILLTGLPAGVIPGFQNYTGSTQADMLRLNMAVPPTTNNPSNLGIIGGDLAGFPNGRRVFDDVTTIELRAIAGATIPLVDPSYQPDDAAGAITQGLTSSNTDMTAENTVHYLPRFPYLGTPHSGFVNPPPPSS